MMNRQAVSLGNAVRSLFKNPGFSVPAFLILTLGIGAATGIFTVVQGVILQPLPFPEAGELVYLCEVHPERLPYCGAASPKNVADLNASARSFDGLGVSRTNTFSVRDDQGVTSVSGSIVSPGFLAMLQIPPLMGRLFADDEIGEGRDGVVVLSHGLWTRRFGQDPDILGRTLDLEGTLATVIGVMPEGFEVPGQEWTNFWKPLPWSFDTEELPREWRGFRALGRLSDGVGLAEGQAELATLYRGLGQSYDEVAPPWEVRTRPIIDYLVGESTKRTLYVFLGAVGLLLMIGCLNVANLLLVRGARQERDFAVRRALGAGPSDLIAQVLSESLVLSLTAGLAGLALAWAGVQVFLAMAPPGIYRLDEVGVNLWVVFFTVALSVAATFLFGIMPAFRSSEASPATVLRAGRGATDRGGQRLRRSLVVVELALSLVLLAAAGLLTRSFAGFVSWDMGFQPEGLAFYQAFAPSDRYAEDAAVVALWRDIEARVTGMPDVDGVATASGVPLQSSPEGTKYRTEEMDHLGVEELPTTYFFDVGPGYFRALGIPVVRGREFAESDDLSTTPVALVNETMARRAWPDMDPLGQRIWAGFVDDTLTVVGVVRDLAPVTPGEATPPTIYWSNRQHPRTASMLAIRTRGATTLDAATVQEAVSGLDPSVGVYARGTVESLFRSQLARPRFNMALIGIFALAAVILAGLGTYAVLAYLVVERHREFGIRIALGSSRQGVLKGVLREGAVLAALGAALGLVGTVASAGLLSGVVYGVSATDGITLAAVTVALVALALLACAVPAVRASHVNPVILLKAE